MPLSDEIATLDEVATALGRTRTWLQRNWLKLSLEHGFPRRHPSGWTWPRRAVAAWLAAGGTGTGTAPDPSNDNDTGGGGDFVCAYRDQLANRYGGQQ